MKARHWLTLLILSFIAIEVINSAEPNQFTEPSWPANTTQRFYLDWKETKLPPTFFAKINNFDQFSLITDQGIEAYSTDGMKVKSELVKRNSGGTEFWFEAQQDKKYFLAWSTTKNAPQKTTPTPKKKSNPNDKNIPTNLERPVGWNPTAPLVEANVIGLFSKPNWFLDKGMLNHLGGVPNDFIVSKKRFSNFDLSISIKPETKGYAGISVAIDNPSDADRAIYWLVGTSAKGSTGYHTTWGIVTTAEPAPTLKLKEWNEMKVSVRGSSVTMFLNGEKTRTIELPKGVSSMGHFAIATHTAKLSAKDLKITDETGKILVQDEFIQKGFPDNAIWLNSAGKPAKGFVRIVNTNNHPVQYRGDIAFHKSPWAIRNINLGPSIAPGETTPWLMPIGIDKALHTPFTFSAYPNGEKLSASGQLNFYHSLTDAKPIRSLNVGEKDKDRVEVLNENFAKTEHIPTPNEIGLATLDAVKQFKFLGNKPSRFPTGFAQGTRADLETGKLLGFTAMGGNPSHFDANSFNQLGYRYIYTYSHLISTPTKGYGYKKDINALEMNKLAGGWKALGLADKVYHISLYDESAIGIASYLKKPEPEAIHKDANAWGMMMKMSGLEPRDFLPKGTSAPVGVDPYSPEYFALLKASHPNDFAIDPEQVFKSLQLIRSIWPVRYSNAREAAQQAFGRPIYATANIHFSQYFKLNLGYMDPWMLYSQKHALDIPQVCDYFIGHSLNEEFLIDLQRSSLNGQAIPVEAYFASQSKYATRSPQSLEMRCFSALGAGAKSLNFYAWGPRWAATENWFSDSNQRLQVIGKVNHAAGWVEDILLDGKHPAQLGIIVSPRSDMIDYALADKSNYQQERMRLHNLFRNLHYQVDFLHDDILPSNLSSYKMLVLMQPAISLANATRLIEWVNKGGTLLGISAIGQSDEFGRNQSIMTDAFGVTPLAWLNAEERNIKGTKVLLKDPIINTKIKDAEVLLNFSTGETALTLKPMGKGKLLFLPFLPGKANHHTVKIENDVLLGADINLQDFIKNTITQTVGLPLCQSDHPEVSARLITSEKGSVIVLINSSGKPLTKVKLTLRGLNYQSAESLVSGKLEIKKEASDFVLELPLELTDIIHLK